ncbi:MAG: glycerophosphodiester phosphodiesterase [Chloroflexi bacterium]|nr:MAG: glycerophosphodiester phosphodiesterase [Chloroflexota bacterium]TMC24892.1 MAG: glycerophosphodiester phosphodiesterase [Chloroflexota bacterium]TMC56785.1 MAG: glycerophosphodiester phosphodiesterase [Chloroflexota bacterium]
MFVKARSRTVGHRGASALAPENTLLAFGLAAEHGLQLVELDVYLSRDGELVVIHDEDLRRVGGRPERVDSLTANELARVDLGRGEGVPRLVDVLELARRRGIGVYVELKGERTGTALGALARSGGARGVEVIGGSFDVPLVVELRVAAPEIPRSVLFRHTDIATMREVCAAVGATYAHPCFRPLGRALVDELHAAGLIVMAPHTNDMAEARAFAEAGIDVLATDDPAVLMPLVAR